ncbi:MAG: hypothetical protein ACOYK7_17195, partial [Pirellulales bacterium]
MNAGSRITTQGGNASLSADRIELRGGNGSIDATGTGGTRNVQIQSFSANTLVGIGTANGTLQLDVAELNAIGGGFTNLSIGHGTFGTGSYLLDGDLGSRGFANGFIIGNRGVGSSLTLGSTFRLVNTATNTNGNLEFRGETLTVQSGADVNAGGQRLRFRTNDLSVATGTNLRGTYRVSLAPLDNAYGTTVVGTGATATPGATAAVFDQLDIDRLTNFARVEVGSSGTGTGGIAGSVWLRGDLSFPIETRVGSDQAGASVTIANGAVVRSTKAAGSGTELGFRSGPTGSFVKEATGQIIAVADVLVIGRTVTLAGASTTMSGDVFTFNAAPNDTIGLFGTGGDVVADFKIGPDLLTAASNFNRIQLDTDSAAANKLLRVGTGAITVVKPLTLFAGGANGRIEFVAGASLTSSTPSLTNNSGLSFFIGDGGTLSQASGATITVVNDDLRIHGRNLTFDLNGANGSIQTPIVSFNAWNGTD